MPLQRVPINNFRGGLNTRDGPFDLQPNESPDLLNVTVSNLVGQLQVRQGKARFDTSGMPSTAADNMQQVVLGSTIRWIMLSINGSIYSCSTSGTVAKLFSGTSNTVWSFAQYPDASGVDKVWCMNGVDTAQEWNGTASTTSDWAATTGTLPAGNMVKVYGNRLWVTGVAATPQRIFFSPFGDPEATTAAYGFIDLRGPEDELDSFIDFGELGTRLYAFKRNSVWVINDPTTLANRRLGAPGVASRFQVIDFNEKLYWFNAQGIWSTAGVTIAYESGSINSWFPSNLNYAAIATARLTATRDSYPRLLLTVATGAHTVPDTMIESVPNINFRRIGGRRYLLLPAYFIHTLPMQAMAPVNLLGNGPWTVIGSDSQKTSLYTVFSGSTDDGSPIVAHWKSSWMAIQGEEPFERIRRLNVDLYGDAIVDVFKDFNTTPDFSATLPNPTTGTDITWDGPSPSPPTPPPPPAPPTPSGVPAGATMPTTGFVSPASGLTWLTPFFSEDFLTTVHLGSWPSASDSAVPGVTYNSQWNQPNQGGSDSPGHNVHPGSGADPSGANGGPALSGNGNGLWQNDQTCCVGGSSGITINPSNAPPALAGLVIPPSVFACVQYVPSGGTYSGKPLGCCISPAISGLNRENTGVSPYMGIAFRFRVVNWGQGSSAAFKFVPLMWPTGAVSGSELDLVEADYLGNQGSFCSYAFHSIGAGGSIVNYMTNIGGTPLNVIPGTTPGWGPSNVPNSPSQFDLQNWHTGFWEWYAGGTAFWIDGTLMAQQSNGYNPNEWGSPVGPIAVPTDNMYFSIQCETSTLGTQPWHNNWAIPQIDWIVAMKHS